MGSTSNPASAITGGDTEGMDPQLASLLSQITELQGRPLMPNDNPMLALALSLSGFGAGMKGQANPGLEMLLGSRKLQQDKLLSQATLALGIRKEKRAEKQDIESRKQAMFAYDAAAAKDMIEKGLSHGEPGMVRHGLARYNKLFEYGLTEEQIVQMSQDPIITEKFIKQQDVIISYLTTGLDLPPELASITPKSYLEMAKTPEGKSALASARKLEDKEGRANRMLEYKHSAFKRQREIDTAAREDRIASATGSPTDYLLLTKGDLSDEKIANIGRAIKAQFPNRPLDPFFSKKIAQQDELKQIQISTGRAGIEIKRLQSAILKEAEDAKKDPEKWFLSFLGRIEETQNFIFTLSATTDLSREEIKAYQTAITRTILKSFDMLGPTIKAKAEEIQRRHGAPATPTPGKAKTPDDVIGKFK